MTTTDPLADLVYAELRKNGHTSVPIELHERDERRFDQFLSTLRYRARRDGYRVYTWRGTRTRPVPVWQRRFELHHPPHVASVPAHEQPRGMVVPDAPRS